MVGSNRWVLLTSDKRIRYNFLEKRALEQNAVREFVFASGNMSGQDMAVALEAALPKMRRFCRRFMPPFVAAITAHRRSPPTLAKAITCGSRPKLSGFALWVAAKLGSRGFSRDIKKQ